MIVSSSIFRYLRSVRLKGIVLAGGSGSRLQPVTPAVSKQLLPIYDKPMIYYPLSVLMLAGIQDILIISTPKDTPQFEQLLGSGEQWGIRLSYKIQESAKGIAHALLIAESFINNEPVCLILGDNLFYGQSFTPILQKASQLRTGALVFAYQVGNPSQFGIIELNSSHHPVSIEEKPSEPKSNLALTGLYFYDHQVVSYAKSLKPSPRGELEITDINRMYLSIGQLQVKVLGRGFAWLDTGTFDSLLQASLFVETIQKRQGFKIACLEEIAYYMNYIDKTSLLDIANSMKNSSYGEYLLATATNPKPSFFHPMSTTQGSFLP